MDTSTLEKLRQAKLTSFALYVAGLELNIAIQQATKALNKLGKALLKASKPNLESLRKLKP